MEKELWEHERGFTLFISNKDINDIIKIIESLEDSGVLIDGLIKTVKHEVNKQEDGFLGVLLAPLAASLIGPVISSVIYVRKRNLKFCKDSHQIPKSQISVAETLTSPKIFIQFFVYLLVS